MRPLLRSASPFLIGLLAFAIAYVMLSIDFKIGEYRLNSNGMNVEQTDTLLPLYKANFRELKKPASSKMQEESSDVYLYQISRTLDFKTPPSEPLTYYAPNLEHDPLLVLNSVLISNQKSTIRKSKAPLLKPIQITVDIPKNYILPNDNLLDLVLPNSNNFAGLNREYLGPRSEIYRAYQAQSFIQTWIPSITLSLCLALTFVSLFGLLFSQARMTYLMTIIIACLVSLYCVAAGNSLLSVFIREQNWANIVSPIIFFGLLIALWFSIKSSIRKSPALGLGLFMFALTGPFLIFFAQSFHPLFLDEVFAANLYLISALPLLIYTTIKFTSYDIASYGTKLSTLKKTIGEQKIELDEKSKIIAEEMRQRAILEERQRMMRDIHDGIGGQLLSLLLRVRVGSLEQNEVATEIQSSLTDLRLVVDSIDQFGGDFASALATFRSRAEKQMAAAGIAFTWNQPQKTIERHLSAGQTLQLYRFMQEVLTNTIRHSKASEACVIIIAGSEDHSLQIIIEDNGIGLPKSETFKAGKGLKNLQARAQKLKAVYEIGPTKTGSGTRVSLSIPPESEHKF